MQTPGQFQLQQHAEHERRGKTGAADELVEADRRRAEELQNRRARGVDIVFGGRLIGRRFGFAV